MKKEEKEKLKQVSLYLIESLLYMLYFIFFWLGYLSENFIEIRVVVIVWILIFLFHIGYMSYRIDKKKKNGK